MEAVKQQEVVKEQEECQLEGVKETEEDQREGEEAIMSVQEGKLKLEGKVWVEVELTLEAEKGLRVGVV